MTAIAGWSTYDFEGASGPQSHQRSIACGHDLIRRGPADPRSLRHRNWRSSRRPRRGRDRPCPAALRRSRLHRPMEGHRYLGRAERRITLPPAAPTPSAFTRHSRFTEVAQVETSTSAIPHCWTSRPPRSSAASSSREGRHGGYWRPTWTCGASSARRALLNIALRPSDRGRPRAHDGLPPPQHRMLFEPAAGTSTRRSPMTSARRMVW